MQQRGVRKARTQPEVGEQQQQRIFKIQLDAALSILPTGDIAPVAEKTSVETKESRLVRVLLCINMKYVNIGITSRLHISS